MRLNCLCGACSNCITLGGLLSSVLVVSFLQCSWGDSYYKFSPGFVLLFVPSGWPAFLHSVAVLWNVLLSMVFSSCLHVGAFAGGCRWWVGSRVLSFHERAFWRDFYYVYWLVVIDSRGPKRCHARVCCPILRIFVLVVHVLFYGFSGMWLRAHIT